jgi:uncharacterized protein
MSTIYANLTAITKTLTNIEKWLDKAEVHAASKSFDPAVLLGARLAPDQFPLRKQLQVATDWVKNGHARLAAKEPPSYPDTEQTLTEIRARIKACLAYVATYRSEDFDGADQRLIGSSRTPGKAALGSDYLRETILPNFYFHATTVYAILRHNGVELGKRDFIGEVTLQDL